MARRVALHTLGCKLNQVETSAIAKSFENEGWNVVPFGDEADLLILNTCTVTEQAETECRKLVRRGLRASPEASVAITGCYAQLRPQQLSQIPGVTAVFGTREKLQMVKSADVLLASTDTRPRIFVSELDIDTPFQTATTADSDSRARGFLKVQDGCDYTCTFCTIPKARGPARAMNFEDIDKNLQELAKAGFEEVVLTGVNMGEYASKDGKRFVDVVRRIDECRPPFRIRVSSIEPNTLSDEVIDAMTNSTVFCPHFHIPLQSGSASVLRRMRRRYNPEMYRRVIERIKSRLPHAGIGADVITGFPGESDAEFDETLEFIGNSDLSYLHVFTYSQRPDTPANTMEQVPMSVRRSRTAALRLLSDRRKQAYYSQHLSTIREWHPESRHASGGWEGWTDNYIKVVVPFSDSIVHSRMNVQLQALSHDYIVGALV